MERKKGGRKRLGNNKRYHNIMLRFNDMEYDKLKTICKSYHLNIHERGVISPLLRRLVLDRKSEERDRLPNTSDLAHHINRIGSNINQLVKLANLKNQRSPNSGLMDEIRRTNELLSALIEITLEEQMG
ncbi:MobC family plasmid mobilization relaxosome protein [Arenibacter algicola]|uniref:plasmid mobilization relaxosome protein MobC n=1 Tax=Arenibacter algicola TaxID=616991 RepID=UPI001C06A829|nr:plasmid mobilization relaxosome protein MobC [Arenibacter algicola]MBU2905260.1 MobC family plasmid mobilization relaxosome protein [Arenibacter algicola]